ncbi:hypothetical protein GCM10022219_05940 [Microbacterium oryzae]|uniref:Sensor-like histidine kinase SenX3 n=1 Tax=Microbacterium oryzae TaxID=743009 RepID=A0A6I6DP80_9MICO|nr:GAF domain-containing sensor histidine kinase [Microbacterium oryzae]QGU26705.1 sensor histidine kinase [Microbacterium oryzae]
MITAQDAARREMIAAYDVVDGPPEPDLEGIVRIAAVLCGVSTAVVNIIDDRQQHQVAAVGFEPAVCSREDSMCAVIVRSADPVPVFVADAREDERFADNPFVTGEIARVRFYASSPLVSPSGVVVGTLCVFDESTGSLTPDRAQTLDLLARQVIDVLELRRMTRALRATNEQLSHFAGQISHDLRSPLTALTGFLEIAADDAEAAGAMRAASLMARAGAAADRMGDMIADVLAFARAGGAKPHLEDVDLGRLAREVVDDLSGPDDASAITLAADVAVRADPALLRPLLQNLVVNARKFAGAVRERPRIEVRAHALPSGWRITVDDDGPGIPVAERERVFRLFERGADEAAAGSGIGLATCRRLVAAHGGQIGVEESPLGGARFWVLLPRD